LFETARKLGADQGLEDLGGDRAAEVLQIANEINMNPSGKCPKCEKLVIRAVLDGIDLGQIAGPTYRGFTILCPHCKTILGTGFDPIALKADVVQQILEALAAHRMKGR
jgi:hypothetical protein